MHIYFLSCFLGIFIKLYDDLKDLSFHLPLIEELAKIVISILTILIYFQNGLFCVIALCCACISFCMKGFDDSFWYAYSGLLICCTIGYLFKLHENKFCGRPFNWDVFLWNSYFVLFFLIGVYKEESVFCEEFSLHKFSTRIKSIGITIVLLFLLDFLDLIQERQLQVFVMLMIFKNSYFLTNIIMLYIYFLFFSKKNQKDNHIKKTNKKKQKKTKKTKKNKKKIKI